MTIKEYDELLEYFNELAERINLLSRAIFALDKRTQSIENILTTKEPTE